MAAPKNPAGGKSDKIWREAVLRAVRRRLDHVEGKPQKLERLADKVVEIALDGDIAAIREIGDRLDGKPAQPIAGDQDNPITVVEYRIVHPKNTDS